MRSVAALRAFRLRCHSSQPQAVLIPSGELTLHLLAQQVEFP
jgi:hypothetical protein